MLKGLAQQGHLLYCSLNTFAAPCSRIWSLLVLDPEHLSTLALSDTQAQDEVAVSMTYSSNRIGPGQAGKSASCLLTIPPALTDTQ